MQSRVNWLLGTVLLLLCATAGADCREWALDGDWTVFYQDNRFPTSVLKPDETVVIQRDRGTGAFSVGLSDPAWQAWAGNWETECINDQTILLGAIQQRGGATTLVIEISRVVEAADLLRNAAGVVRERQINIRFPQPFAAIERSDGLAVLAEQGVLASHPGHAHGDD
jgi:hypothetical protein